MGEWLCVCLFKQRKKERVSFVCGCWLLQALSSIQNRTQKNNKNKAGGCYQSTLVFLVLLECVLCFFPCDFGKWVGTLVLVSGEWCVCGVALFWVSNVD